MNMGSPANSQLAIKIRKGILASIILNFFLVAYGLWLIPTALKASSNGVTGLAAVSAILIIYFVAAFYLIIPTAQYNVRIIKYAFLFGITAGLIFGLEVIFEYIMLPASDTNVIMGYAEFGSVFLLYLIAGFWGTFKTQKYFSSLLASFWSAIIASLIWLNIVLLVYYCFRGTNTQMSVLLSEGDFEDFKQSGMKDFDAFIIQDFWGAGFFHLLISPIIASILGAFGGLVSYVLLKLKK